MGYTATTPRSLESFYTVKLTSLEPRIGLLLEIPPVLGWEYAERTLLR
jgi:hypothetical protein